MKESKIAYAGEVKRISDGYWSSKFGEIDNTKYNEINELIIAEAEKGNYFLTIYKNIDDVILHKLKSVGFHYSIEEHMGFIMTTIDWVK